MIFNSEDICILCAHFINQFFINGFHESHINDMSVDSILRQQISRFDGRVHHAAECEDGHITAITHNFPFPNFQGIKSRFKLNSSAIAARIAHRDRPALVLYCREEHITQLTFIFWRHDNHSLDTPQISKIKHSMMRWSIGANQSCTIKTKNNMQMLYRDIMNDLIKRSLKECRIN